MKRILAAFLAAALAVGSFSVGALASNVYDMAVASSSIYDEDGNSVSGFSFSAGKVTGDYVLPDTEYYLELPTSGNAAVSGSLAQIGDVTDTDQFSFKLDRDKNGKYLDEVKFVSKRLDGTTRKDYIKFTFKETDMTNDEKVTFDVYFKAKKDNTTLWNSGDKFNIRFELWVQNDVAEGEDADLDTGSNVVFKPVDNETNTITWGSDEEIASLKFEANDDADKFYAKLSTKSNSDIYSDYGDPVNAELYFRTFVGSPSIDSTSRATLTLYNPWYDDDKDDVDPHDVYIYEVDGGSLVDLTDKFTYVDEDDTDAGIDGWQIKVRTLSSYVISDTELDAYDDGYYDEPVDIESPVEQPTIVTPPQALPSTGAGDFASAAALSGAVALGLWGCLRKRRK